jgi:4-amino-4-deoxy-L-arabinose transferase-like glycosyltransferase
VSRPTGLALAAIVAVAAALRLHDLEHAQFRHDDETMFSLASEALRSWAPPIHGMDASMGLPHGPVAVYLLMLPVAVTGSESASLWFVALLNVGAVALTFLAMRRFVDERAALLGALLMATNPWFVVYGRRIWLNALLPLAATVFLWTLLRLTGDGGRRRRLVAAALAFAALVQVYLGAAAHAYTALAAVVLLGLWRDRSSARAALVVMLAALAPYAGLAVAPRLVRLVADATREPAMVSGWPVRVADWTRAHSFLALLRSDGYERYAGEAARVAGPFAVADAVLLAAFAGGVIVVGRRAWRSAGARRQVDVLLLVFVAAPVVLPGPAPGLATFRQVFPYHFLVTAPALFLLAGEGFVAAADWARRRHAGLAIIPVAAALAVAALHVAAAVPFFGSIREYWPRADYGLPLAETRRLVSFLDGAAGGAPIVITGRDEIAEVTYRLLQRRGGAVAYVDDRSVLPVVPGADALYVGTDAAAWSPRALVERAGAREVEGFGAAGGRWTARVFRLDAHAGRTLLAPAGGERSVDGLVTVTRVEAWPHESAVEVTWRLLRAPRELAVAQIVRADDETVLAEAEIVPADARPADAPALARLVLIQRFVLPPRSLDVPIAFRLVTRWGHRPLTHAIALGTLASPHR